MNNKLTQRKNLIKTFFFSSLLTVGLSDFQFRQACAQVIWKPIDTPKAKPSPMTWGTTVSDSVKQGHPLIWLEVVPETENQSEPSSMVIWEVFQNEDERLSPVTENESTSSFIPPNNLKEAEALLKTIPLQSSDFKPLLNLSNAVPTASVLTQEEWRLITSTISPFKYASGTGNQNYAIQLDYGLNDTFQISGFYSEELQRAGNFLPTRIYQ